MPHEVVAVAPKTLELREYDDPSPGPGQVKVKTEFAAAKHGTEMAYYKGYANPRGTLDREYLLFRPGAPMVSYPAGVGNMCVGTVVEVGPDVTKLAEGDRVFEHSCFREVCVWPETVRKLPEGVSWKAAVCVDPAEFALGAIRDGNVRMGDAVAVFGLGAIGQYCVQMAKRTGADPVIGIDLFELRRDVAAKHGADLVIDPTEGDVGVRIKDATEKRGVDVSIDFSGSYEALHEAIRCVAFGGTVVAGAWPGACTGGLDLGAEAHFNRPNLVFARSCSDPSRDHPRWDVMRIWDVCQRMLFAGELHCEDIVQPVVPFSRILEEYPKIDTDPGANLKLGVEF